eukprot:CAMPEP_0178446772 /NCGR_PEP_ID=MMETSP0689_2-20121128/41005_1 /TAXON_ID=160604 /ORGANISM="Amphidinium massartii, Strain CS-259" /LENGTH=141 /DNA_ID=CAMNT_0020071665 /DNA_START=99 /DNA_END=520 /DNA_ORIENTATION=-
MKRETSGVGSSLGPLGFAAARRHAACYGRRSVLRPEIAMKAESKKASPPTSDGDAEGEAAEGCMNYEDAFKSRLQQVRKTQATSQKERGASSGGSKTSSPASSSDGNLFGSVGNVEAPKGTNNFLSLPEWRILLGVLAFLA